jgi:hypothetical protein
MYMSVYMSHIYMGVLSYIWVCVPRGGLHRSVPPRQELIGIMKNTTQEYKTQEYKTPMKACTCVW